MSNVSLAREFQTSDKFHIFIYFLIIYPTFSASVDIFIYIYDTIIFDLRIYFQSFLTNVDINVLPHLPSFQENFSAEEADSSMQATAWIDGSGVDPGLRSPGTGVPTKQTIIIFC